MARENVKTSDKVKQIKAAQPKREAPAKSEFKVKVGEKETTYKFSKGIYDFNLPRHGVITVEDALKDEEVLAQLIKIKAGIIEVVK